MTAALPPEIALEILASHGADPARWPADVRPGLLALAAQDSGVAAALAQARALDAALADWAAMPAPDTSIDVNAILKLPQEGVAGHKGSGWRPALIAASAALVLAVGGWLGWSRQMPATTAPQIAAVSPSAGASAGETDDGFAYVFTPTAAEEDLI